MMLAEDHTPEDAFETRRAYSAFGGLLPVAEKLRALEQEAENLMSAPHPALARKARKLRDLIQDFEPGVTFIGQVKAGKTTLVNAMTGWPGLLPADVNPWTSVVTSVHLTPPQRKGFNHAAFRFFSNEEWDNLIHHGGRLGEIASRAGAADEVSKVREQLDTLREKSRQRLGRRFEMLLGQTHTYDTLTADLVKRYVSLGDNFWEEAGARRLDGQFADITKSADLWFPGPDLPLGLCIQDTPGVNDTFMIREQITLRGLRGSKLCVMVLSAQQALSSVDLGLIRLISNIKSRDVVIFVNRIDELENPARDVPKIRESILATLAQFNGPEDAGIVFGSAYWAEHMVAGTMDALGVDSSQSLLNWAENQIDDDLAKAPLEELIWRLSGAPALGRAISNRIAGGAAKVLVEKVQAELMNLKAAAHRRPLAPVRTGAGHTALAVNGDASAAFAEIERRCAENLSARLAAVTAAFDDRTQKSYGTFLDRATAELLKHLAKHGDGEVWSYDPSGLRMLLRTAYKVFVAAAAKAAKDELDVAAQEISALLQGGGSADDSVAQVFAPPVPPAEAPVTLAQTIALDLKGSWWTRFWRKRRGYEAFADDFAKLIEEETANMLLSLREDCVDAYAETLRRALAEFLADQRDIFGSAALS
ncbi:MAG: dynamin family protein [Pseudomonadota bacterium]